MKSGDFIYANGVAPLSLGLPTAGGYPSSLAPIPEPQRGSGLHPAPTGNLREFRVKKAGTTLWFNNTGETDLGYPP